MKKIISFFTIGFLLLCFISTATAYTLEQYSDIQPYGDYSGVYVFTVVGMKNHDQQSNMVALTVDIEARMNEIDPTFDMGAFGLYDKYEHEDGSSLSLLTYTFNDTQQNAGTWTTNGVNVQFYTVKTASEFAIYFLGAEGLNEGTWTTEHVHSNGGTDNPQISHMSTWNQTTPVPEPSTLLLMGVGLLGLAAYSRKRFAKKG